MKRGELCLNPNKNKPTLQPVYIYYAKRLRSILTQRY